MRDLFSSVKGEGMKDLLPPVGGEGIFDLRAFHIFRFRIVNCKTTETAVKG